MGKMGAPVGNQNVRKHGFYSKILTETEKLEPFEGPEPDLIQEVVSLT